MFKFVASLVAVGGLSGIASAQQCVAAAPQRQVQYVAPQQQFQVVPQYYNVQPLAVAVPLYVVPSAPTVTLQVQQQYVPQLQVAPQVYAAPQVQVQRQVVVQQAPIVQRQVVVQKQVVQKAPVVVQRAPAPRQRTFLFQRTVVR